jgi:hypothetical protein
MFQNGLQSTLDFEVDDNIIMSSKAPSNRQIAPLTARSLKIVGIIIILAALLDIFVLPIPYQPIDRQWQISFVTQVVDRGIVPLVGLSLLLVSSWIESLAGMVSRRPIWQDLRFWALLLACLLGLFHILAIPLHINNVRVVGNESLQKIEQEATQAESQLGTRLNQEVGQQRDQINQLLSNEDLLNQALQSGQVSQEQAQLLQQFKQDPQALDKFVQERVNQLKTQLETEIGVRREQAQRSTKMETLKSSVRVGIGSFLLAIGYIFLGWTGLRNLGKTQ